MFEFASISPPFAGGDEEEGDANRSISEICPNVAYLRRGKTRKSASDVAARRFGQVEAYFTVREVLSEPSTVRPELTAEGSRRWRAIARV